MVEDKTRRALRARVVDSFMARDEEALDIEIVSIGDSVDNECEESTCDSVAWLVLSSVIFVLFRKNKSREGGIEVPTGARKVNAGFQRMNGCWSLGQRRRKKSV